MSEKNVDSRCRILLDIYLLGQGHAETLISDIEFYSAVGYQFVAPSDVVYIPGLQEHVEQFRELVQNKKIVVEHWSPNSEIDVNEFEGIAFEHVTPTNEFSRHNIFEGVIRGFQNREGIAGMQAIIEGLGSCQEEKQCDLLIPNKCLSTKMQKKLNLPADASRYEVFKECYKRGLDNLFRTYNYEYVKGRAYGGVCDFILNSRGKAVRIY